MDSIEVDSPRSADRQDACEFLHLWGGFVKRRLNKDEWKTLNEIYRFTMLLLSNGFDTEGLNLKHSQLDFLFQLNSIKRDVND